MIRIISVFLTFIGGLYFFLEFLLPEEISLGSGEIFKFGRYFQEINLGVTLVSQVAVGLGVANILMVHGRAILSWKKGAFYSFSLLAFFFIMLAVQFNVWISHERMSNSWRSYDAVLYYVKQIKAEPTEEESNKITNNLKLLTSDAKFAPMYVSIQELESNVAPLLESGLNKENLARLIVELSIFKATSLRVSEKKLEEKMSSKAESLLLNGLFFPLGTSMFSLLAFYIGFAAYRTFRVQSKEAMVMMVAAFLFVLGQVPQGYYYISEDLPHLRFWLLENLSTPAFRAIYFSSSVAGLALAVRMWFSMEKKLF